MIDGIEQAFARKSKSKFTWSGAMNICRNMNATDKKHAQTDKIMLQKAGIF